MPTAARCRPREGEPSLTIAANALRIGTLLTGRAALRAMGRQQLPVLERSAHAPESSSRAPVALVFLGCGDITKRHSTRLRRFRHLARYHASRDLARAASMDQDVGGSGAFGSYDEALADARVTCAVVATPPATHLALTLAALEAGKDVVVEKPAFLHSADVDTVRAVAERVGRQVLVAENYHYKPLAYLLREIVASGELGEVLFVHVNALKRQDTPGWRADADVAGGGALFEGGVHWMHLMANLGLRVPWCMGCAPAARVARWSAACSPRLSMLAGRSARSRTRGRSPHHSAACAPRRSTGARGRCTSNPTACWSCSAGGARGCARRGSGTSSALAPCGATLSAPSQHAARPR
ncbi:MAG: Gfo/Idh/MocA family oxidoreductase [Gemmatimonadetes bacterium]|nr:Gfo/Idh/MocA family oxidoreductase [Gemmatimonadota bacterium]